jgi:hypothetical protein
MAALAPLLSPSITTKTAKEPFKETAYRERTGVSLYQFPSSKMAPDSFAFFPPVTFHPIEHSGAYALQNCLVGHLDKKTFKKYIKFYIINLWRIKN